MDPAQKRRPKGLRKTQTKNRAKLDSIRTPIYERATASLRSDYRPVRIGTLSGTNRNHCPISSESAVYASQRVREEGKTKPCPGRGELGAPVGEFSA